MTSNIEKILDVLKEGGCRVREEVPFNDFGDKFIDVNGVTGCARHLDRLGRDGFLVAYKEATTFALISPPE